MQKPIQKNKPTIYIDLDGVTADIAAGFKNLYGIDLIPSIRIDWCDVSCRCPDFFSRLPKCMNVNLILDRVKLMTDYNLSVLSICPTPMGRQGKLDKINWVKQHIGKDIPVIVTFSDDKSTFCEYGDILIDDDKKHERKWIWKGGIFIHHIHVRTTLDQLNRYFKWSR